MQKSVGRKNYFGFVSFLAALVVVGFFSTAAPALSKTINVTLPPYSAVGDGATNDSQAITQAFAAAKKGDTVLFPSGTYLLPEIGSLSVTGFSVVGDSNPTLDLSGNNGNYFILNNGATFNGLVFTDAAQALSATGANWQVTSCSFSYFEQAILVSSSGSGTVTNCTFSLENNGNIGVSVSSAPKINVENSTFNSSANNTVGVYSQSNGSVNVTSNTFNTCGTGVAANSAGSANIRNNICSQCDNSISLTSCDTVVVTENTLLGIGVGYQDNECGSVSVTNNAIDSSYMPIVLNEDAGPSTISGNTITRAPYIHFNGGSLISAISVTDNGASLTILRNNITSAGILCGIATNNCNGIKANQNTVNSCPTGVFSQFDSDVTIQTNSINNCATTAISLDEDEGSISIASNKITNVTGQSGDDNSAAIGLTGTSDASIKSNNFTQNGPTQLSWYIYDSTGTATLSNNKTNTDLPSNP